jgi:AcrR family transcriptional regulator
MGSPRTERSYGGKTAAERASERRQRLLGATITVLAESGEARATMTGICAAAGLTERYFYESFTDRDEFVRAVYDDVCAKAMSALSSSTTARDAVERFVALMVDDPTRGRVLLLAPAVEPVLTRSGADWMPIFIDLLQRKLIQITEPAVQAMVATGLIGALTALFTAYLNGRLAATREQFIDYCVEMLLSRVSSY